MQEVRELLPHSAERNKLLNTQGLKQTRHGVGGTPTALLLRLGLHTPPSSGPLASLGGVCVCRKCGFVRPTRAPNTRGTKCLEITSGRLLPSHAGTRQPLHAVPPFPNTLYRRRWRATEPFRQVPCSPRASLPGLPSRRAAKLLARWEAHPARQPALGGSPWRARHRPPRMWMWHVRASHGATETV